MTLKAQDFKIVDYAGAKFSLAPRIANALPYRRAYLEPFLGSGAVFFCRKPSPVEVLNDLNREIVNLFRVLRAGSELLAQQLELTPYARQELAECLYEPGLDSVEQARRFVVRCYQAMNLGRDAKPSFRREKSSSKCYTQLWGRLPERVMRAGLRLKQAQIENVDAVTLMQDYQYEDVSVYLDPPYYSDTRYDYLYEFELSREQHEGILLAANAHPGPCIISGYACMLYDHALKHWDRLEAKSINRAGAAKVEVLWRNKAARQ